MKQKILLIVFIVSLLVLPHVVSAVSWWPLVPCGLNKPATGPFLPASYYQPCNQCELLHLFRNIIDFTLVGLMPPIATILFVWGGFLILSSAGNPGRISQGKTIFWNTVIGIAIISASWLITNTIIRSIAADNVAPEWWKFQCSVTTAGPPAPPIQPPPVGGAYSIITSSLPDGIVDQPYNQTIWTSGGTLPISWTQIGSLPTGLNFDTFAGVISGTPVTTGTFSLTIKAEDSSSPKQSAMKQFTIKVATQAASVVVSNVTSSNITNNSATVTWTTDKPSTSQVEYGTTTAYGSSTVLDSNQVTSHSVNITGLSSGTVYNYRAISSVTGFTAKSSNNTFKTTGTGTIPPAEAVCPYTGVNLCQPQQRPGGCSNSLCPQYVSAINQYAGGVASANLLKAIMINESSCDVTKGSGTSYGLMALSPGTVTAAYKSRCGISLATQIDQAWLTSPANASLSICLAAEYIRALGQSSCGSSVRHIAANYNGGNACAESINCASETSCDGGRVRRWECLYDDNAHNVCNTGFDETRGYAPKVLYCYNNPGF